MAKVYAPNRGYTGISAGVSFFNGIGETGDPWLIEWFKRKGYNVEKEEALENLTVAELRELAQQAGVKDYHKMRKKDLIKQLGG